MQRTRRPPRPARTVSHPYFEGRVGHSWDQLGARTSDEDYGAILKRLKKRPFDYFSFQGTATTANGTSSQRTK